jgi:hypothetical protein
VYLTVVSHGTLAAPVSAQDAARAETRNIHEIVTAVSAARIERDIRRLVSFGTRNTLSDTLSPTRGIGAARRWIKAEFDRISEACEGCLEVFYVSEVFPEGRRIPVPTNIVNVAAIQRGSADPNRMVIMAGDIDSRISDATNAVDSSPGANDNASGMAGTIEAARVLTRYRFDASIVYLGLSGEEQGLYGGGTVARYAREHEWSVAAMLNNDMIGNIEGVSGVIDNTTARVFSEPTPPSEAPWDLLRTRGGEVDGKSRQLARYVDRMADLFLPTLDVTMIYRLDRFGRGGHHTPFATEGFPAVRIMESHENYTRQHQDIRTENGIPYGDVVEGVNFEYAAKLTALNAVTSASLAWAPGPPANVSIQGAVQPAATLMWDPPEGESRVAGYRVYWRLTDSPTWDFQRWVGKPVDEQAMAAGATHGYRFEGMVIDNYYFGVAAVGEGGSESTVVFPIPRPRNPAG